MESKYLVFKEIAMPPSRRTKVFKVLNKTHGYELGEIKWYAPWRQYCFFCTIIFGSEEVYSWKCMLDIVEFIRKLMIERKMKA